jgi:hypothetical protein
MSGNAATQSNIPTVLQPQMDKVREYLRQQDPSSLKQQSFAENEENDEKWFDGDEEVAREPTSSPIPGGTTIEDHHMLGQNQVAAHGKRDQRSHSEKKPIVQLGSLILNQLKKIPDMEHHNSKLKEFQEVQKWLTITGFYDLEARKSILALHDQLKAGTPHTLHDGDNVDDDPFNVQDLINQVVASPSSVTASTIIKKEKGTRTMNSEGKKFIKYVLFLIT